MAVSVAILEIFSVKEWPDLEIWVWGPSRSLKMARFDKGKGKGLDTCYSATYMSQTRDQQRFTISEVAADWHEPYMTFY